jgi:hypothetical protein
MYGDAEEWRTEAQQRSPGGGGSAVARGVIEASRWRPSMPAQEAMGRPIRGGSARRPPSLMVSTRRMRRGLRSGVRSAAAAASSHPLGARCLPPPLPRPAAAGSHAQSPPSFERRSRWRVERSATYWGRRGERRGLGKKRSS